MVELIFPRLTFEISLCKYFASCLASSVFPKKNKTLRGNNLEEESS